MSKNLVEIQGFKELQSKLKQLPDKVKRKELLKILGQVANSTVRAAKSEAPKSKKAHIVSGKRARKVIQPGSLKKSIYKIKGKRGAAKVNAVLYVGPRAKRNHNGFYGAFVAGGHRIYRKGFKRKHSSSASKHNDSGAKSFVKANPFIKRAYNKTKGKVSSDLEKRVVKYIDKQVKKLSK